MKVSTFPESSFFDDLHSLTQLHHLSGELDMVLAFVRLDIGEHPDEDNFPPNFWIISAVAEQLGALSVEADFTRPHLEKMVALSGKRLSKRLMRLTFAVSTTMRSKMHSLKIRLKR
ncbi:hypothetical protein [Proteus mirabilis]|uniref:hypothetical protein n=1 Tax=Proteus mirabilis TaxID=584 RepID=UPI0039BDC499